MPTDEIPGAPGATVQVAAVDALLDLSARTLGRRGPFTPDVRGDVVAVLTSMASAPDAQRVIPELLYAVLPLLAVTADEQARLLERFADEDVAALVSDILRHDLPWVVPEVERSPHGDTAPPTLASPSSPSSSSQSSSSPSFSPPSSSSASPSSPSPASAASSLAEDDGPLTSSPDQPSSVPARAWAAAWARLQAVIDWFRGLSKGAREQQVRLVRRRLSELAPLLYLRLPGVQAGHGSQEAQVAARESARRFVVPTGQLDVERTLRATARRGGLFVPVWRKRHVAPEYLVLVHRMGAQDLEFERVRAQLAELASRGVRLHVYPFRQDERAVTDALTGQKGRLDLPSLYLRHPEARLVIVSHGGELLHPFTQRPEPWTDALLAWPRRALITPVPGADWGSVERVIHRSLGFSIASSQEGGLYELGQLLGGERRVALRRARAVEDPVLPLWVVEPNPAHLLEMEPTEREQASLIRSLQDHLGPMGFHWLGACAHFPSMAPAVALAFGRALFASAEEDAFERGFAKVAGLPWMRKGRMPYWLRRRVVASLDGVAKAEAQAVVREVLDTKQLLTTRPEEAAFASGAGAAGERALVLPLRVGTAGFAGGLELDLLTIELFSEEGIDPPLLLTPEELAALAARAEAVEPQPASARELVTAPAPAGPPALDRYRQRVRAELDQLPSVFRRGGAVALSRVYVEVRLTGALPADPEAVFPRHEGWAGRDLGGRLRLRDLLDVEGHRHWALLGDPGSGKTTLLNHLGLELLDEGDWLPIVLRVAELSPGDDLQSRLEASYGQLADVVMDEVRAGRAVVLLDGLDEHPSPADARWLVAKLAAEHEGLPVFVTSRPIGYQPPSGSFAELWLCPLDEAVQAALLGHWVDDPARVHETLATMRRRTRLRKLVENPLLLTLVGIVVQQSDDIPTRLSRLYGLVVGHLLRGAHRAVASHQLRSPALAEEALGRLALAVHGQERRYTPERELLVLLEGQGDSAERLRATWPELDEFLRDVAETTGLLVPWPDLQRREGYSFPHRSLREFLAAKALEIDIGMYGIGEVPVAALEAAVRGEGPAGDLPPAAGALGETLRRAIEAPATWAEVLSLTCGLLGEGAADQLVRRVAVEGSRELVARVVGGAEAIASDTVRAALGVTQGQEEWETRRDLLQQLPSLVGDAEVVMQLLSRFAQTTTHGADLWWVDHVLTELSRGVCGDLPVPDDVQVEAGRRASAMWAAHRPEDRAAVVAELAPLWRKIPAGTFLMGSPASEEGRNDDEGPQHSVTVAAGFEMMAVPVVNALYERFDPGHREDRKPWAGDDHPVGNVTWYEAAAFARWLGACLPHEVEWEYACRAGTTTRFWSGDDDADLERVGWVRANSGGTTHPVGAKPANPWGLHDMHGHPWEWCSEDLKAYHSAPRRHQPITAPTVHDPGAWRVIRGGSFLDVAQYARSAHRYWRLPSLRDLDLGFRLVRASAPQP